MYTITTLPIEQRRALAQFTASWFAALRPGSRVRLVMPSGELSIKDELGWRQVGSLHDFLALARALGRLS